MPWFFWFLIGTVTGVLIFSGASAAFCYYLMHSPRLMQEIARRMMHIMFTKPKDVEKVP